MGTSILFVIGLQIALIALNAIFACAEIAVISINDNKLAKMAQDGDKRAKKLSKLTAQPARFLATIQVAITLSGFLGSAFAAENFSDPLVDWLIGLGVGLPRDVLDSISVILITVILSYLTLVFGELVPKQIGMRQSEKLALGMSGLISGISKIFAPLVWLLTASTNGVLRLFGIDPNAEKEEVSEEEIRMMVDVGSENGTIDDDERDFIQNVFDFDNLPVEDIVTHRTEVVMLYKDDTLEEWEETIYGTGYTYYPVCDGTPDQVIGVLNTKKYFRLKEKTKESIFENAVLPPYFVPEALKADVLFKNMREERVGIAVVLDEYGGMSGIVTIKDLLEELVGDLEDDIVNEEPEKLIEEIADGLWRVDGSALVSAVEEALNVKLESEEAETISGLIFNTLGYLPEAEDELEIGDLKVHIAEIDDNKIATTVIRKL